MKCSDCGMFVKNAVAEFAGPEHICNVEAECSKCGLVNPEDWEWDDFAKDNSNDCPCDSDYCHIEGDRP